MALRCAGCGYDNDPTRVYCHNCGTKLERDSSAVPPPTGFTHPTETMQTNRPLSAVPWGKYCGFLFKLSVLAGLLSAVVLALLPPRGLPAPVAGDEETSQRLSALVGDASESEAANSLTVAAMDLQKWLAAAVQMKSPGGPAAFDPRRIYIVPLDGKIRIGLELALPGEHSVFMEGEYWPSRGSDGYKLQASGYSIGRLPLPPVLAYPVERQFNGLRDALAVPLAQLAKASFIEIAPEQVSLRWPGNGRP